MITNFKNRNKGFTIIEVMIVLAIAGLILLIVFLAIPALQRSQANTGRKEDAGRLVTAFGNYISDANGQLPTPGNVSECNQIKTDAGTLNQYNSLTCTSTPGTNDLTIISSPIGLYTEPAVNNNSVIFVEGATCSGTTSTSSSTENQTVILYTMAPGGSGSWNWACTNAQ